jgi:hypothetical protein
MIIGAQHWFLDAWRGVSDFYGLRKCHLKSWTEGCSGLRIVVAS